MSDVKLLADASEKRTEAVAACNKVATRLVSQLHPFMSSDVEAVLSGEDDEVWKLAMDLVDKHSQLRAAHNEYEALRRRA